MLSKIDGFELRRSTGAGCIPALAPWSLGRRRGASAVGLSAGVRGFVAFLRYGPKGAPPWAPASEPTPGDVYKPGMPCRHCGMPHAELVCVDCGQDAGVDLICDRCTYTEPFSLVWYTRARMWRAAAALLAAFALGTLAGRFHRG